MACRVFHVDFSGFDNSDARVTRCVWCPDFFHPDLAHHPGGQVEHVAQPSELVVGQPDSTGEER